MTNTLIDICIFYNWTWSTHVMMTYYTDLCHVCIISIVVLIVNIELTIPVIVLNICIHIISIVTYIISTLEYIHLYLFCFFFIIFNN